MSILKQTEMSGRLRSAGPMVLVNYTDSEVAQLRQSCSRKDTKIKYLAIAFSKSENNKIVQIAAQAYEKISPNAWREQLGFRIKEIRNAGNLKHVVEEMRKHANEFLEYGSFGRQEGRKSGLKRKQQEEFTDDDVDDEHESPEIGKKLSDQQALLVHRALIMARDAYLKCYELKLAEPEESLPRGGIEIHMEDICGISRKLLAIQEGEQGKRSQQGVAMARNAFLKRMRLCELDLQKASEKK